ARQQVLGGGLAGAVVAQQGEQLAAHDRARQGVYGELRAEARVGPSAVTTGTPSRSFLEGGSGRLSSSVGWSCGRPARRRRSSHDATGGPPRPPASARHPPPVTLPT